MRNNVPNKIYPYTYFSSDFNANNEYTDYYMLEILN